MRTPRPLGTRVPITGLAAISRSRTAQPKNADKEARNRRTDDSASPDRFNAINAPVTSRSVTAPIWSAARAGGVNLSSAESATYVLRDKACSRSWSHSGSGTRTVRRLSAIPPRGTPGSGGLRSLAETKFRRGDHCSAETRQTKDLCLRSSQERRSAALGRSPARMAGQLSRPRRGSAGSSPHLSAGSSPHLVEGPQEQPSRFDHGPGRHSLFCDGREQGERTDVPRSAQAAG